MSELTSNQLRDTRGRYTSKRASIDDLKAAASTSITAEASSSPNVPGGLPRVPSPPISSSALDDLPTNFTIRGAEHRHLLSRFSDNLATSSLPVPLKITSQLTSATAREGEQSTSATTPMHSSATTRPDTPPMPIRRLPSWPQIYSFDQPLLEQPDFDQPSSDSNEDAPIVPATQTQNPTHALSAYYTFALPLNAPAPQATANPTHAPSTYQPFAPPLNAPAPQAATNIGAPAPRPT